jgi:hypothetical protein
MEYFLPVRAQYAVVLAYNGDFDAARKELSMLTPFHKSVPPEWIMEVENQAALIKQIEEGKVRLSNRSMKNIAATSSPMPVRVEKHPGRNEPCSCGSGKKFKKCCGR